MKSIDKDNLKMLLDLDIQFYMYIQPSTHKNKIRAVKKYLLHTIYRDNDRYYRLKSDPKGTSILPMRTTARMDIVWIWLVRMKIKEIMTDTVEVLTFKLEL